MPVGTGTLAFQFLNGTIKSELGVADKNKGDKISIPKWYN